MCSGVPCCKPYKKYHHRLMFEFLFLFFISNLNCAVTNMLNYVSGPRRSKLSSKVTSPFHLSSSDRHHTSSAIPVPKRQSSMFGGADVGFSGGIPSPDKGHRKRASSENERLQYKTPPPSYNSALTQPGVAVTAVGDSERKVTLLSSSLDTSLDFSKENKKTGVVLGNSLSGDHGNSNSSQQGEALPGHLAVNGTALPGEQSGSAGALLPGPCLPAPSAELCCAVEQAEEIIGLEATGFTSGDQLEALSCIPVDSAVAVECDEQVLGEFEEFSRRIYALSENVSSFRRPRRSSDK